MFTYDLKGWQAFFFMHQTHQYRWGSTRRLCEGKNPPCVDLEKAPLTSQKDLALLLLESRKHWAVFSLLFVS